MYHPVLFIVGPTGSGKSHLAFNLALRTQSAILNCDSIQVYQKLNIGSAKPSVQEMSQIPHLLFDFISPPYEITAGEFRRQALEALKKSLTKGPVIAVGGSGFYIQALQKGMYPIQSIPSLIKKNLQEEIEQKGLSALYEELLARDPEYAAQVNRSDSYRIVRGLSILRTHSQTLTEIQNTFKENSSRAFPYPYQTLGLTLERTRLKERLLFRSQKMLEDGLVGEVEELCRQGWSQWAPMRSVGYKETLDYLTGKIKTIEELKLAITQQSMRLAKRQSTWFSRDKDIKWFHAERNNEEIFNHALKFLIEFSS